MFDSTVVLQALRKGEQQTPYPVKELFLEHLADLCSFTDLVVEIFVNNDCDLFMPDTFANLGQFLYDAAFPKEGRIFGVNLAALDSLLAIIQGLALRRTPVAIDGDFLNTLEQKQAQKALLAEASAQFNEKPELCWEFMQKNNLMGEELDAGTIY